MHRFLEHMEIHHLVTQRARKKGKKPRAGDVAEGATSFGIALSSSLQQRKIFNSSLKESVAKQLRELETAPRLAEHLGN